MTKYIALGLTLIGLLQTGTALAERNAATALAERTAKHMSFAETALSTFGKGVNSIAQSRAEHIKSIHDLVYASNQIVALDVGALQATKGEAILKMFGALRAHGDQAVLASSKATAAGTAEAADIAASYTPLNISTEKLGSAAKTLAGLGTEQSTEERALFMGQFLADTHAETKKLLAASEASASKADSALDAKVAQTKKDAADKASAKK